MRKIRLIGVRIAQLAPYSYTLVTTITISLVSLPVVVGSAGTAVWSIIAVGQNIGGIGGLLTAFGWGANGPTAIAKLRPEDRADEFAKSISPRLLLAGPAIIACVAACVWLTPAGYIFAATSAVTVVIASLGGQWYFIGEAKPLRLYIFDTLPKAVLTAAGLGALMLGAPILTYLVFQLLGSVIAVFLTWIVLIPRGFDWSTAATLGNVVHVLRVQSSGAVTVGGAAAYAAMPLIVVASVSQRWLAEYALADKLSRFGLAGLSILTQVLQGWVPRSGFIPSGRARTALKLASASGVVTALLVAIGMPALGRLLTREAIVIGFDISIPVGIALGLVAISQCCGLVLLAGIDMMRVVAASTVVGAVFGLPTLFVGGALFGGPGVAWALAVSELVVLAFQAIVLFKQRSRFEWP